MLEPARTVVEICGGVEAVARMVDRDKSNVYRWGYSKEKGGTGGLVPQKLAPLLLKQAKHLGLRSDHFFPDNDEAAG